MPRCMLACSHRIDLAAGPVKSWIPAFGGVLQALAWVLILVGSAGPCSAQSLELAGEPWLRVEAQEDPCIAPDGLTEAIKRMLEHGRPRRVRVRVRARAQGWVLELWHANGQHAVREFPVLPEDCAERQRALALATALAVEHAIGAKAAGAPGAGDERPRSATIWSLGIQAGASLGELPTPSPVLAVHASVERGVWVPVEVRALMDVLPSQVSLSGAQLSTRQLTGALGSCAGGGAGGWRIDGCLGVEAGGVLGRGEGLARAERDTAGSGALNLGVAARWSPRPSLALTARIEGFVRFWVPRFQVLDVAGDPLAGRRLPPAGGRLWFGLAWVSQ